MVTELLGCKADRNTPSEATVLIASRSGAKRRGTAVRTGGARSYDCGEKRRRSAAGGGAYEAGAPGPKVTFLEELGPPASGAFRREGAFLFCLQFR